MWEKRGDALGKGGEKSRRRGVTLEKHQNEETRQAPWDEKNQGGRSFLQSRGTRLSLREGPLPLKKKKKEA